MPLSQWQYQGEVGQQGEVRVLCPSASGSIKVRWGSRARSESRSSQAKHSREVYLPPAGGTSYCVDVWVAETNAACREHTCMNVYNLFIYHSNYINE